MTLLTWIFSGVIVFLLVERLFSRRRHRHKRERLAKELVGAEHEKKRVIEFMHALIDASQKETPVMRLYEKILSAAARGAHATGAAIFIVDDNGKLAPALVAGLFPSLTENTGALPKTRAERIENCFRAAGEFSENTPVGTVAQTRRPLLISHGEDSPLLPKSQDPALAVRSLVVVPVAYGERLLGVLAVANPSVEKRRFSDTDLAVVKSVGEQAGMALYLREFFILQEEKSILDFDLSLAGNVQKLLLPKKLPKHDRLDVAAHYRPMQKVGGDLYAVVELPGNRVGAIVADVSGKGIQAALIMAICRTHLKHLAQPGNTPADVLRKLNAAMKSELGGGRYITAVCAVVDIDAGTLTLARAGHELPLLLEKRDTGAEFVSLHSEGTAVGLAPPEIFDASLTQITIPFERDSTLVFFTDGLTEARAPDGLEFTSERLKDVVRTNAGACAEEINNAILSAMETFRADVPLGDDLTLVTMKLK